MDTNKPMITINTTKVVAIITAADVTPECLNTAEEIYDGFYTQDDQIDWWSFLDRLEAWGWSAQTIDSPAVNKIKRHISKIRNQ
jgi:hypothetical protein